MPFANTWKEEAAKYGITANDNKAVMPILKEFTNDPKFLSASDKRGLKGSATPAKTYELIVNQLKARVNYKYFQNAMTKVMKEKKKDDARRVVMNTVKAQMLRKLKTHDPALVNALSSILRGNIGVRYQHDNRRTIENAYLYKLKKYVREYDSLDKRKTDDVSEMFHKYEVDLKKIGVYWNRKTKGFNADMPFKSQKVALEKLYVHYKSLIKKIGR